MDRSDNKLFDKLSSIAEPTITTDALAEAIDCSPGTLRIHRCLGVGPFGIKKPIPYLKIGNRVRYQPKVVINYLVRNVQNFGENSESVIER